MSDRVPPPAPPRRERAPRVEASPGGSVQSNQPMSQSATRQSQGVRQAPTKQEGPPQIAHGTDIPSQASRPTPPPVSQQPQGDRPRPPAPKAKSGSPAMPQVAGPAPGVPAAGSQHLERARPLPGESANRLAPHRTESNSGRSGGRATSPPSVQRPSEPAGGAQKQPGSEKQPGK